MSSAVGLETCAAPPPSPPLSLASHTPPPPSPQRISVGGAAAVFQALPGRAPLPGHGHVHTHTKMHIQMDSE